MSETKTDHYTVAMEYAIQLADRLLISNKPNESVVAIRALIAHKLYLSIINGRDLTGEHISKIIETT